VTGVEFDEAWPARLEASFDGKPVGVMSREYLIQNKRATGRPQDIADIHELMKAERES
jgi:hypothetical protein